MEHETKRVAVIGADASVRAAAPECCAAAGKREDAPNPHEPSGWRDRARWSAADLVQRAGDSRVDGPHRPYVRAMALRFG
jgi:hypothetical protein